MKKRTIFSFSFIIVLLTCTAPLILGPKNKIINPSSIAQNNKYLRLGTDLCPDERNALKNRLPRVLQALQNFTGENLTQENIPSIGIVCSGGGLRASTSTIGLLKGLDEIGLLDGASYIAALSGSTWTTAAWIYHSFNLNELESYLQPKFRHALIPGKINTKALFKYLYKLFFKTKKYVTLNDTWGTMLGNIFLETTDNNYGQQAYLQDIQEQVSHGDYPIPLFTAVHGKTTTAYEWAEFSPFEIGSTHLSTWTKPENFGENLGYLLGLWGSAFAFNGCDVASKVGHLLPSWFSKMLTSSWLGDTRMSIPTVKNFTYQLNNSAYKDDKYLTFCDAGFAFNLPFPPLLRRNIDVYIVSDACFMIGEKEIGDSLKHVEKHAKENGYPFPIIDYEQARTQHVSIFMDENNPKAPVVIYVPNFRNISTLDFNYSKKKFNRVVGDIKNAITSNVDIIREAIIKKAR